MWLVILRWLTNKSLEEPFFSWDHSQSLVSNLNITTSRVDIGQKEHQNPPPPRPLIPSLFLIVLHQIKALHNFCKRGQCSDHTEYTLTSDYNNFPNDLCDSKNALGLKPWPSQWVCNVLITRIFPTGEWRSSLTRQKFTPLPPLHQEKFPHLPNFYYR